MSKATILKLQQEAKKEAAEEIKRMEKEAQAMGVPKNPKTPKKEAVILQAAPPPIRPAVTSRKEHRTFIMPEIKPKEKKVREPKGPSRTGEAELLAKYPHVIAGTLQFDQEHHKQSVEAKLQCGHVQRLFTSDLWQVKKCKACKGKADKVKNAERLAKLKESKVEKTVVRTSVGKAIIAEDGTTTVKVRKQRMTKGIAAFVDTAVSEREQEKREGVARMDAIRAAAKADIANRKKGRK